MSVSRAIFLILRGLVRGRAALTLENLALRRQLNGGGTRPSRTSAGCTIGTRGYRRQG